MQKIDDEDLQLIGHEQTTPVFWKPAALYNNPNGKIGALSVEKTTMLATIRQFDATNDPVGSVFQEIEPGSVVQLAEGFFVLDEGDFPR